MLDISDEEEQKYEEDWYVSLSSKTEHHLSKLQALVLKQEIASGNRATIMFETFAIPIPYLVDFYRLRRYKKREIGKGRQLSAKASEKPYKPIPKEKWDEFKKKLDELGIKKSI